MKELVFEPQAPYNKAMFSLYEQVFILYKRRYGEEAALDFFRKLFSVVLRKSYDSVEPPFTRGNPEDFARLVGERDKDVGLKVSFQVDDNKIIYRFHTDPFPGLRGEVEPEKMDATYMIFKVFYLLGEDWSYRTTKHLWKGDEVTEHVVEKD